MFQSKNNTIYNYKTIVGNHKSELERSYEICEAIIEKHSKSFAFASRFLEKETKKSVVALYAFCRMVDDIVDETTLEAKATAEILDQLKFLVDQLYYEDVSQDPVLYAFGVTVRKHNIPKQYVHELIEGVRMDLYKKTYSSFDELYLYSYRVASTVGLMMTHIFLDNPSEDTLIKAESLGIAMQLTNILRDIKEDLERGRVYLPQNWLQLYNVDISLFQGNEVDPYLRNLISYLINLTRKYYKIGFEGIADLPPGVDFVVALSGKIYSGILNEIEKNDFQVLKKRYYVSKLKKVIIATRLRLKFRKSLKTVKVISKV